MDDNLNELPTPSTSSSDSEGVSVKKQRLTVLPYHIANTSGLSEETLLLLNEIRRQRILFDNRISGRLMSKIFAAKFENILATHGVKMLRKPLRIYDNSSHRKHFASVNNLTHCLKEVRALEDEYGRDLWVIQFLLLHNLLVDVVPEVATSIFRSSMIDIYIKCLEAIDTRKWHLIAKHVSEVQFSFKSSYESDRQKTFSEDKLNLSLIRFGCRCEPVLFYYTSLFLASVQRHLQLHAPPGQTCEFIDETIVRFQAICQHRLSLWSNPSSFFVLNGLIFKTCHGFYDKVMQIVNTPLLQLDSNWQCAYNIYRFVSEYELFCDNKDLSQGRILLGMISGYFDNLARKERGLILLPILIELCVFLDEEDFLFYYLSNLCMECPVLFKHICQMLISNGHKNAPLLLFESLISSKSTDLAAIDLTPDLLKTYSSSPEKYGSVEDVVKTNLETAFSILDYGRNRNNIDAWSCLYENLKRVESAPEIINQFWALRKSWWPAFHLPNSGNKCQTLKNKCFKRLNHL